MDLYVLKYPNGSYVGQDSMSGGYPYEAIDLGGIAFFPTAQAADDYRQIGGNYNGFTIHKITGIVTAPIIEQQQTITVFRDPQVV